MLLDTHLSDVWSATAFVRCDPADVLEALTDPELISRWAPVAFEVEELDDATLQTGTHARIYGSAGGLRTAFYVDVTAVDDSGLELVARGPVNFEVCYYRIARACGGVRVDAFVALSPGRGLTGRLVCKAAAGLLRAGALSAALERIGSAAVELSEALIAA